jgi:hypothetical protein
MEDASIGGHSKKLQENQLALIAVLAALALFGVVMVTVAATTQLQEAEGQRGCPLGTPAPNASKARCFRG